MLGHLKKGGFRVWGLGGGLLFKGLHQLTNPKLLSLKLKAYNVNPTHLVINVEEFLFIMASLHNPSKRQLLVLFANRP